MRFFRIKSLEGLVVASLIMLVVVSSADQSVNPSPANAAAGDGISAYISPPFVQGPPSAFNATVETFDSLTVGPCNTSTMTSASSLGTYTGDCRVFDGSATQWGGAQTTTDTPTVGALLTPSKYISPGTADNNTPITLTLTAAARYLGFWWAAGSSTDTVKIFKEPGDVTPIATYTLATINSVLGGPNPPSNVSYSTLGAVAALNGDTYNKAHYWGRPFYYSTTSPTAPWSTHEGSNIYLHAYINIFTFGGISFKKLEFSNQGFEVDNFAVSSTQQTPPGNLVFLESIIGKSVEFKANGGSGAMSAQTSDGATSLTPNNFTRTGYTFTGWHTTSSGTGGISYNDGDSFNFSNDLVLHAQWSPIPYTITYNTQGGTSTSNDTYTIGSTVALPAAPTRDGFLFDGWFENASGGTALGATFAPSGTGDITLYAQWRTDPSIGSAEVNTTTTTTLTPVSPQATVTNTSLPKTGSSYLAQLGVLAVLLTLIGFVIFHRRTRLHWDR